MILVMEYSTAQCSTLSYDTILPVGLELGEKNNDAVRFSAVQYN